MNNRGSALLLAFFAVVLNFGWLISVDLSEENYKVFQAIFSAFNIAWGAGIGYYIRKSQK